MITHYGMLKIRYLLFSNCYLCVPIFENILDNVLEPNSKYELEDTLGEVILCDTFLYSLFA